MIVAFHAATRQCFVRSRSSRHGTRDTPLSRMLLRPRYTARRIPYEPNRALTAHAPLVTLLFSRRFVLHTPRTRPLPTRPTFPLYLLSLSPLSRLARVSTRPSHTNTFSFSSFYCGVFTLSPLPYIAAGALGLTPLGVRCEIGVSLTARTTSPIASRNIFTASMLDSAASPLIERT